jgi:purine-nucleoside phosphorylase
MIKKIQEAADFLQAQGMVDPQVGVILGTGLGTHFVEQMKEKIVLDYEVIPYFPVSTVEFHHGKLIFGEIRGRRVMAMQGRFHYYEGYSLEQITFPVRVMKVLGIGHLLISNAAGNLNANWKKGELMLLDDHINLLPDNPLRGKNLDNFGPRFPDMSQPYSATLNNQLMQIALEKDIRLNVGVYVVVSGPNLETRAEYRFMRIIGADAVGMSTVPEVIVANHMQLPCCAISVLTDDCNPDNLAPANINDIVATAGKAEIPLTTLYTELIGRL